MASRTPHVFVANEKATAANFEMFAKGWYETEYNTTDQTGITVGTVDVTGTTCTITTTTSRKVKITAQATVKIGTSFAATDWAGHIEANGGGGWVQIGRWGRDVGQASGRTTQEIGVCTYDVLGTIQFKMTATVYTGSSSSIDLLSGSVYGARMLVEDIGSSS